MNHSSLFGGLALAALFGCAVAGDSPKLAPVLNQPKLVIGQVGPYISGTDPFPIPPEHAGACEQVVDLANKTRARGELFYAISEPYREIVPPEWEPLDYRDHKELIVEGFYKGWCDEQYRVDEKTGELFTDEQRAECREWWKGRTRRETIVGDARLERAPIDIDRDGDTETVYQFFPDPSVVATIISPIPVSAGFLVPSMFVSPNAEPETHRRLSQAIAGPASLFFWRKNLYIMQAWESDKYQLNMLMVNSVTGVLNDRPICKLEPEGRSDDQRQGAGRN